VLIQTGGNEKPDLGQNKRRSQKDRGQDGDLYFKVESARQGCDDHLGTGLPKRCGNDVEQLVGKVPAHAEGHGDGNQAVNDAFPQFLEVIEERHLTG
jgi:hypothetical protein